MQDAASILLGPNKSGVGPLQGKHTGAAQSFTGLSEIGLVLGADIVSTSAIGLPDSLHSEMLDPDLEDVSGD